MCITWTTTSLLNSKRKLANWEETELWKDWHKLLISEYSLSFPSPVVRCTKTSRLNFVVVAKDDWLLELLALIALRMNATWEPCYITHKKWQCRLREGGKREGLSNRESMQRRVTIPRCAHHWPIPDCHWINSLDKIKKHTHYITHQITLRTNHIRRVASIRRSDQCSGRLIDFRSAC